MTDAIRDVLALFAARGFDVRIFDTAAQLRAAVLAAVPDGCTAGFGGSVTCQRALALPEGLEEKDCTVYSHWRTPAIQDPDIFRKENSADVFFTSCNAITLDGKLMNNDGFGNRLSGICYGPGEVFFLAGTNKFVRDYAAGMERIYHVAYPKNVQRLHADAPCARVGVCLHCGKKQCETSGLTLVVTHPVEGRPMHLWVADESLGF